MSSQPKISIVTPSYNQGSYIEDAIESVMKQEYSDFEHIIIDAGSTDNTLKILKKYPHLIWTSEPDKGQSDAINKGFKKATGQIIGWLNADDYYLPCTFKKVTETLKDQSIDGVYSNLIFVDEKGKRIRELTTHKPVRWLSVFHCFIPSATFFFRRSILDSGVNIDKDFEIAMDKEFFAHIFNNGFNLIFVNDVFACFRWHKSNKSLDTARVKRIRRREGLVIFNRYSGMRVAQNKFTMFIYSVIVKFLLIYRCVLKFGNHNFSL